MSLGEAKWCSRTCIDMLTCHRPCNMPHNPWKQTVRVAYVHTKQLSKHTGGACPHPACNLLVRSFPSARNWEECLGLCHSCILSCPIFRALFAEVSGWQILRPSSQTQTISRHDCWVHPSFLMELLLQRANANPCQWLYRLSLHRLHPSHHLHH